jgi:CBS domain-containing protein
MQQWRVRDVMTTDVITTCDDASFAEIAAVLADHRISAVAIVDRFDAVGGVVYWADLFDKICIGDPDGDARRGPLRRRDPPLPRWYGGAAAEVTSAPPITIGPDASLPAAARLMYSGRVGRLLVADDHGRLRSVVTRSDPLKVHARLDAVIRDEVMQRVLCRTLMIEPGTLQATVDDGVVTLTGRIGRRTTAVTATRLTEVVTGVTGVVDRLAFDFDDIVAARRCRQAGRGPLRWSIAHQPGRPAGGATRGPTARPIGVRTAGLHIGGPATIRQAAGSPPAAMTPPSPQREPASTMIDPLDTTPGVRRHLPDADAGMYGVNGHIVDEWGWQSFPVSDRPGNW